MESWKSFLQPHVVPAGAVDKPTHVSMISKQRFRVPPEAMTVFWQKYADAYTTPQATHMGMLEMSVEMMPVIADFDRKIDPPRSADDSRAPFPNSFVRQVVHVYQNVLHTTFDVPRRQLCCFILRKDPYLMERNGRMMEKHGFHLHFPCVFLHRAQQREQLIPRVLQTHASLHGQRIDDVLDQAYCRGNGGPWLLYGSRKHPSMEPYLVHSLVDGDGKCWENGTWRQVWLDMAYPLFAWDGARHVKTEATTAATLEAHLPRIFSLIMNGRDEFAVTVHAPIAPLLEKAAAAMLPQPPQRQPQQQSAETREQDTIAALVNLLDEHRARDRNEWIRVGWILYNVCEDKDKGLALWQSFSQRCPEAYDARVCCREWSMMKVKPEVTIGSLKYLARKDDPEGYEEVVAQAFREHIQASLTLNGTHNDIAHALYAKYQDRFVCSSIRERQWYVFRNHVWEILEEGFSLRAKISSEVVTEFHKMAERRMRDFAQSDDAMDKEEQTKQRKKVDAIMRLIAQLKSAPFKSNIMKEASEVFFQPRFLRRLDANELLFTFQNGVLDLSCHEFREGRPEDFQSMQAPVHYRHDLHEAHPDVRQVLSFLEKVFPDRSVRDYFMDVSADVFVGGNINKIIQIWTGDGDNGKSVTQQLFERMLGPYAIKLPTALITGKRTQSSSACPELVRAGNGVRLAMLQEPDQKDVLNIGILKELSGNDTFFARGLYKEGSEIRPMFKLVLVCNDPPKVPYNDRATWNRIRVIPFESTFADDAPGSAEEQLRAKRFPKDKRFGEKIPSMVEAFAWLLVDRLRRRPQGYVQFEPEKVRLATANYQRRNDTYRQFVDEMTEASVQQRDELSLLDVYSVFKDWFRESVPGGFLPTKTEVRDYLVKTWGEPDVSRGRVVTWRGKRFVGEATMSGGGGMTLPPPVEEDPAFY